MTKTTFVNGTTVTPDFLNAINNPTFDGQDLDGHFEKITNDDLSDEAGQIKPEWTTFRDTLKVTAATGLTVSYQGGSVILADGTIATISPANLSVTNNTTNYVYVNEAGVVAVGNLLPVRCTPLARVITSAGSISSVVDLRPRFQIQPRANTVPSFGSGGYEGDLTISSNQSLSGTKYVRNFTLNSGVTLTVSGFLHVIASGTVTIDGTINVTPIVPGGRGFGGTPPGTTSLILADSGLGNGGGGGHNSSPAPIYSYSFSGAANTGSGGAAGLGLTSGGAANFVTSKGGAGGGVLIIDAAGAIAITGNINCDGGNATIASINSAEGSTSIALPGGGGGSGGLIWLKSLVSIAVSAAAVLSVKGGNGANGVRQNFANSSGGGSGGGGGYVVLQSPATNTTGATITLTGGTGGNISGTSPGITASLGGTFGGQCGAASDGNGGGGGIGQLILQSFLPI